MSVIEATGVLDWLLARLAGDAALCALLPLGARAIAEGGLLGLTAGQLPVVVVAHLGGEDTVALSGVRVLVSGLYLVRVMGLVAQAARVEAAADRADTLLHVGRVEETVGDVRVRACVRERILPQLTDEAVGLGRLCYRGGEYRVEAQAA
jgi:hypothetical protein